MSIGGKVNYYFAGTLIILVILLALLGGPKAWGILHKQTLLDLTQQLKVVILQNQQLLMKQVLNLHQQLITLRIQI